MDRREFFRRGFGKATKIVVDEVEQRARKNAAHWIRPPFAIEEIDFLLKCSRCDDCARACEKGVIFPLPARRGAQVVGTPVLDLLNKSCDLCDDWPCVNACQTGALQLPEIEEDKEVEKPRLALAVLDTGACLPYLGPECGACYGICPIPGALVFEMEKPIIDKDLCVGCALCREVCVVDPRAILIKSLYAEEAD